MIAAESTVTRGIVVGHGLDIVDIDDFSRLTMQPANAFLDRYFTGRELFEAGEGVTRTEKLAGRFAIKEAVMKALGVGWGDGVAFRDVEVVTLETGAPTVLLHRKLARHQDALAITGWLVTSSHSGRIAVASVIALGRP